ncbi:GNAT family N-acetyltransferase [Domibacillus sp. DTU_2020_1001157_1_SI_ALB_TIR_016]|uniref:GNAT family N-acetyltransferase n=1 Tax=Domibacillus sp. DTU_2020_1001157_1_SI_ALB_TIR_016 TaxID=3077789 RepID=UPI0028E450FE|nr:GNAT family N-acetyltransferase [Domibacillus sp. DTU_2020_1001157_1_SI_ALB_TIR_016]WNS79264.1 GNAT family N-acetyltransferase [Domibacillus sp. DTU_2020_1001157_1_SI_ALB_TIR_016]
MDCEIILNPVLSEHEILNLWEAAGWKKENSKCKIDCLFWAGVRDSEGHLIAFGGLVPIGLTHGYISKLLVHPRYQDQTVHEDLHEFLLSIAKRSGTDIVSVTPECE